MTKKSEKFSEACRPRSSCEQYRPTLKLPKWTLEDKQITEYSDSTSAYEVDMPSAAQIVDQSPFERQFRREICIPAELMTMVSTILVHHNCDGQTGL